MSTLLRIATRKSPLALWQAEEVARQLKSFHPELEVELVPMTTKGDQILNSPLSKVGGKGLFVKELEVAMLEDRADIAVHSMKDVPMEFPEGLQLSAILKREDPRDAFLSNKYSSLDALPDGAILGTASLRRQAIVKAAYPNIEIKMLRGNINTRIAKLEAGEYDAIILAASGLKRMGFDQRITAIIPPEIMLPAVGQGALGIEARSNDAVVDTLLAPLRDTETTYRLNCERAMNNRLNGGCQIPVAGYSEVNAGQITLRAFLGYPDGSQVFKSEHSAVLDAAEALGTQVAEDLIAQGGDKVLDSLGIEAKSI
jgi:hydroxymethylbilane synthase